MKAPDYIEPIVAWRIWRRDFQPLTFDGVWDTEGWNEASCRIPPPSFHPREGVPHPRCGCGFWCFRTIEDLFAALTLCVIIPRQKLLGQVEIKGKVIEGDKGGYRAQYARILLDTVRPLEEVWPVKYRILSDLVDVKAKR